MTQEPPRLTIYLLPRTEPERGRYLAALIRQEWHEGMTHAELVTVTTNLDAVRLMGCHGKAYLEELEQQWRGLVPVLTLPGILAALGLPADPGQSS